MLYSFYPLYNEETNYINLITINVGIFSQLYFRPKVTAQRYIIIYLKNNLGRENYER